MENSRVIEGVNCSDSYGTLPLITIGASESVEWNLHGPMTPLIDL